MSAHSIAEQHDGYAVCLCGEEFPVYGTTRESYSRAFRTHCRRARERTA